MTRKLWLLTLIAVALGGVSLYLNTDWFSKEGIHITHRSRPVRSSLFRRKRVDDSTINPIFFAFDRKLKLSALRIVPLSDVQTNKYPHPVWDLVSESNSVPTKDFAYGMPIKGMHPAVKGANPDPLEPDVPYRLYIEADGLKAEHDFTPQARTP